MDRIHTRLLRVWYQALRPFSYSASVVPVLVGSAVAWSEGHSDLLLFIFALIGSISIQAGTNLANEYFDYMQGVDKADSLGPAGVILQGKLRPRHVLLAACLAFVFGAGLGIYIAYRIGWVIVAVGVVSLLAAWFYAAKPLSLGYRGLGELEVFIFMGPVTVLASYYVQAEAFAWKPLFASLPVGLLVMAILHANNLRDVVQDNERRRVTWAVLACRLLGFERGIVVARWIFYAMLAGAYATVTAQVALNISPIMASVTFLTIPQAYRLIRFLYTGAEGRLLSRVVRATAYLHMSFGAALTLGYLLGGIVH